MLELLWLIPAMPLAGFLVLVVGRPLSHRLVAVIGAGSVGLSAVVALLAACAFLRSSQAAHCQPLWQWLAVAGFSPRVALYLDGLSVVMMLVVTVVGFLIVLYSTVFMAGEEGYGRFFAYMDLFVAAMLVLVLADDLLLLYLGWEGVGLCSYLLIGFWYKDPANGRAAMKAFLVTRVGDAAMAVGLFLLFACLGSLQIQELTQRAAQQWAGSPLAVAAALLLLGGAVGKSAQLPLQTWLPDAMAGPTPVSALIHAATMVTAGVYLIARMHVIFALAGDVQLLVAVVGAATLLLAGFSALVQRDIKRVLAYSTISQIGYMFLGLGVGAWSAAIYHFVTHAFFKSCLFLAAGVVIQALHHEHDMFKMGGLRRQLPVSFWTFLICCCALASVPPVTGGFFSKDLILYEAWRSPRGGVALCAAGMAGVLLTSTYTFRMLLLTYFGPPRQQASGRASTRMSAALICLTVLVVLAAALELPRAVGGRPLFTDFLKPVFPSGQAPSGGEPQAAELILAAISQVAALAGLLLACVLFLWRPQYSRRLLANPLGAALHRWWLAGWGFDGLYDRLLVRPFVRLARADRRDLFDSFYGRAARITQFLHRLLSATQTGQVRWYAAGVVLGAIIILAIVVLL